MGLGSKTIDRGTNTSTGGSLNELSLRFKEAAPGMNAQFREQARLERAQGVRIAGFGDLVGGLGKLRDSAHDVFKLADHFKKLFPEQKRQANSRNEDVENDPTMSKITRAQQDLARLEIDASKKQIQESIAKEADPAKKAALQADFDSVYGDTAAYKRVQAALDDPKGKDERITKALSRDLLSALRVTRDLRGSDKYTDDAGTEAVATTYLKPGDQQKLVDNLVSLREKVPEKAPDGKEDPLAPVIRGIIWGKNSEAIAKLIQEKEDEGRLSPRSEAVLLDVTGRILTAAKR